MKIIGKIKRFLSLFFRNNPPPQQQTSSTFDSDDLRRFLPTFLSQGSQTAFIDEIKQFLKSHSRPFYTSALEDKELLFQGDGIRNLPIVNLPEPTIKLGSALLLSNTCDVDPSNKRLFDGSLTYAPIFSLQLYLSALLRQGHSQDRVRNHESDIRKQLITQIFFLPKGSSLTDDSLVFLDRIVSSSSVSAPREIRANRLFTLSDFGAWLLALKLSIHFCRIRDQVDRHAGTVT